MRCISSHVSLILVVEYVKLHGGEVVGTIADNASNMQAALRNLWTSEGIHNLACLAHAANLLVKELIECWGEEFGRAKVVEQLFRTSHYPRGVYMDEMKKTGGHCYVNRQTPAGVLRWTCCEVLWGTELWWRMPCQH